jgi:LacI family transcriptional regulator
MGYQRDPALTALVGYRRKSPASKINPPLAYLTNWESRWGWQEHPAHRAFFEGAQRRGAELGYQLEHHWLRDGSGSHRQMSRFLSARGVAGIILASREKEGDPLVDFEWSKFSAVKIDASPCSEPLHTVTNDQRTIVALAMKRVMSAGYRRIGFVMPLWWDAFAARAWSAGFLGEQQRLAPAEQVPILYFSSSSPPNQPTTSDHAASRDQLSTWLRAYRPEVIVSCGPFVKSLLAELAVSIPQDIAFVDIFLEHPDGITAGVYQNCHRVGELAVEAVADRMHEHLTGVPKIPTATLVEGMWHDGTSLPLRAAPRQSPAGTSAVLLPAASRVLSNKMAAV